MNRRDYKNFSSGSIFHIYNRGNNREDIFYNDEDYRAFLFRLSLGLGFKIEELDSYPILNVPRSRIRISAPRKGSFKLHAFCLMRNHFHLLIEQCSNDSISGLISKLCTSYAKYFNLKYKRVGHVFQDKFKSVLIEDNPQLMWTSTYIHINPVRAGYVADPGEYKWSSFVDYTSNRNLPIVYRDTLDSVVKNDFARETIALATQMSKTVFDTFDTEF